LLDKHWNSDVSKPAGAAVGLITQTKEDHFISSRIKIEILARHPESCESMHNLPTLPTPIPLRPPQPTFNYHHVSGFLDQSVFHILCQGTRVSVPLLT